MPKAGSWLFGPLMLVFAALAVGIEPTQPAPSEQPNKEVPHLKGVPIFRAETIRGRVVWLAAALRSEFGITTVAEVSENALAILTDDGKLIPIVENLRGRAFRKEARLRDKQLELAVRSYEKHPLVQIVNIYEVDGDHRYEIDYWCDICAIVMYEPGPCSCCQDDNRMRKRRVVKGETLNEEVPIEAN